MDAGFTRYALRIIPAAPTARDSVEDRVKGLEAGYRLPLPFPSPNCWPG